MSRNVFVRDDSYCENRVCFCYVCGDNIVKERRHDISKSDEDVYCYYFGAVIYRKMWAPSTICTECRAALKSWWSRKLSSMKFGVPMQWSEPDKHDKRTCYFCLNYQGFGFNRKRKSNFKYQSTPNAIRPMPHDDEHPVPNHPRCVSPSGQNLTVATNTTYDDQINDPNYLPGENVTPQLMSELRLNKLVRELHLSRRHAEILARELKLLHVLAPGVKVTGFRHRQEPFMPFFTLSDDKTYAYCHDIATLMLEMGVKFFDPDDWRIFIDSSKSSLKTVLLHKDSSIKPVPILYALGKKEDYDTMKWVLDTVYYENYLWRACCDLKVLTLLTGLQTGYTKYSCPFCVFDTRDKNQYANRYWPPRTSHVIGRFNVRNPALIERESIMVPPLHMKLGLVKNLTKAFIRPITHPETGHKVPKNQKAFDFLKNEAFPALSMDKVKEGKHRKSNIFRFV